MVDYRRAQPGDLTAIIDLQNRNLEWNLAADERAQGFLSTAFSIDQFRRMDEEIAVVVALFAYVYWSTRSYVLSRADQVIAAEHAHLHKAYESGGRGALIDVGAESDRG